jgi:hypothetical protein
LQKQLAKLVRQEGAGVMDNKVQLQSTITAQARKTGVNVANLSPGAEKPDANGFFEEESIRISVDSQEPQLVDFLYNIGGDPAMIRVSELDLAPQDQNRYRLRGNVTLIANYANRAPPPAAATPAKPAPGKPAIGPGSKPSAGPATAKLPPGQKSGPAPTKPTTPAQRAPGPNQRAAPAPGSNSNPKRSDVPPKNATG